MGERLERAVADGIYWLTTRLWVDRVRRRYLGRIHGLEHLPPKGPYIVIANHASFMDHFALAACFQALVPGKVYFLTKKESFVTPWSRWWHQAVGAIPIDREGPSKEQVRRIKRLLAQGRIVVIYPEGTRSDGRGLLPFKPGAFKIATRMGVDVVPVGLVGTARVLPKGKRLPRAGRIDVAVGPPLDLRGRPDAAAARETLAALAFGELRPELQPARVEATGAWLLAHVAAQVEALLEEGVTGAQKPRLHCLWRALDLCPPGVPRRVLAARVQGLLALATRGPRRAYHALRALGLARRVLREDARHPMGHYIVAAVYGAFPGLRRLCREARRAHLARAQAAARAYGHPPEAFQLAHAQVLLELGRRDEAARLLGGLLEAVAEERCGAAPRAARRRQRARELLAALEAGHA